MGEFILHAVRPMKLLTALLIAPALALGCATAFAEPSPPPAKEIFGRQTKPVPLAARAIGAYSRGCLAGARMLAVNGKAWQAMRLSRRRNWGHPRLVAYIEKLAEDAQRLDGWPGLLVGDMSQPMGGPMLTGHASHQIGLDVDIWFKPMPPRELTAREREDISADSMLGPDKLSVNPQLWTPGHVKLVKRAASYGEVSRIFVHPAIKKALCEGAGEDRDWLNKVRPWWGHHYHFHVRLACPSHSQGCVNQSPVPPGDGCGKELDDWFALLTAPPKPPSPQKPKPPLTLADLPKDCAAILAAAANEPPPAGADAARPAAAPDEPSGKGDREDKLEAGGD
jgi:penicillin-insensitive murein endopeptidase